VSGEVRLRPLTAEDVAKPFSCDDEDLNGFFHDDALRLQEGGIARVYVAERDGEIVGYVALSADMIELKSNERRGLGLPSDSPKLVPAVKVGRLAVATSVQRVELGTILMRVAVNAASVSAKHVGCRLITVDAYSTAVKFYEQKLLFVRNKSRQPEPTADSTPSAPRTISMRLDLQANPAPPWLTPR
jgi:predicted N-acetyltransferase YhbS